MKKLMVVFGTRPEVIKLAPVILEARKRSAEFALTTVATGQHREMLAQALASFGLVPDVDLELMEPGQTLAGIGSAALAGMAGTIERLAPDWVVIQGDTTTAFSTALAAFFARKGIAHVEAGLRTRDLASPFPEEANRQLIARVATLHLAPTESARRALLAEGIADAAIRVTGNTVVDAIRLTRERWAKEPAAPALDAPQGLILVTCHRREHFGGALKDICAALKRIALAHPERTLVFPVHLNPNVRPVVTEALGGVRNIRLLDPVDYDTTLRLLERAVLALTDSGGIQEEAPSFGVPTVVMRKHTERVEGVEQGFSKLVGSDPVAIEQAANAILADAATREQLRGRRNPYGDGFAAARILDAIARA